MPSKKVQNFSLTPLAQTHTLATHTEQIHIQMRTKALLLAAAFAAAGVATSMAQVYSVNAVGYVNTTLHPGFNLVSNPLNASDNTIGKLFLNMQGGVPGGTTVFKFKNGSFLSAQYDDLDNVYSGNAVAETTVPGEGVFVFLTGTTDKVLTFVGEVVQGPTTTDLPRGFSIKSSVVPQAIVPSNVKNTDGSSGAIPAAGGDSLFKYNPLTRTYASSQFDDLDNVWSPALPTIGVGEAFYYFRAGAATTWNRTFSVNNPQ